MSEADFEHQVDSVAFDHEYFDHEYFDQKIVRADTACVKYDVRQEKFGRADVIPLWVADMDFATAPRVQAALKKRAEHPIFGYTIAKDSFFEAFCGWYARRHGWKIDPARALWAPGTVTAMAGVIEALCEPGDQILVPTPVYPPFLSTVRLCGCEPIPSPVKYVDGVYRFDLEHLEDAARAGAKMLLLCNPHNPLGRAWHPEELLDIARIAERHGLIVVSDEVHADFVYLDSQGNLSDSVENRAKTAKYTPFLRVAPPEVRAVALLSSAKTFNLSGTGINTTVFSHAADQKKVARIFERNFFHPFSPFTTAAFEAAWRHGDAWLDGLLDYLNARRRWLHGEINALPGFKARLPEATYLLWVDARETGMDDAELSRFFVHEAGLGIGDGPPYGPGAHGHIRFNFATRQDVLSRAISQLGDALARR